MGTSTNRNLQAKYVKAKSQKVEAAKIEFSKPFYSNDKVLPAYDVRTVRRVAQGMTMRQAVRLHF